MTQAQLQTIIDAAKCVSSCAPSGLIPAIQTELLFELLTQEGVEINSTIVNAIAVNPNTYAPNAVAGASIPFAIDQVTGGLMVMDRAKDFSVDSIRAVPPEPTLDDFRQISCVNGDGTTYIAGTSIDLSDFTFISIVPEVTVAGTVSTTVFWKMQWSFDNSNWIDDFLIDPSTALMYGALGTPAGDAGGRLQNNNIGSIVRSFPIATGFKGVTGAATGGATAMNIPKQSRYARFLQRMNAAVTGTQTVKYHFTLY